MNQPVRRHTYQNHHLDSTRWDYFEHRPGDIVISTSYKAGTTWMQAIIGNLLFPDSMTPVPANQLSPWLDSRNFPLELVLNQLREQTGPKFIRRFIKTHLPLDGLPFHPEVQYVVVGRDARDVFMSLLNHWSNHTPMFFQIVNSVPGRVGDAFPVFEGDIHSRWRDWMTRGWFDWETDGYPYWSHLHHCASWWEFRELPNIHFVHYADLLADLEGQMRRLARELEIPVPEERWAGLVNACTFASMKEEAERSAGTLKLFWKDGASTFFNKGTNGRWRDTLSAGDLALYEAATARTLTPECRRWLEEGGAV